MEAYLLIITQHNNYRILMKNWYNLAHVMTFNLYLGKEIKALVI